MLRQDFNNTLRQALSNNTIFQQVKGSLQETLQSSQPTIPINIPFCGSLSAKVAVLLDLLAQI